MDLCRLLVVDDDPSIRYTLHHFLKDQGFTVSTAPDGAVAAGLILNSPTPFDLLITDIVMPGMNGLDLAEFTADVSPVTRVMLISSYVPTPRKGVAILPFLAKPLDLDQLLAMITELLGEFAPSSGGRRQLMMQ
jgi:two-component system, cell cycle response regulator CpdR